MRQNAFWNVRHMIVILSEDSGRVRQNGYKQNAHLETVFTIFARGLSVRSSNLHPEI